MKYSKNLRLKLKESEQREQTMRVDLESQQQLVKELDSSLAASKLSKDLELKRLKEVPSYN